MFLTEGIKLTPFDNQRWVVNTNEGRNFLVNDATSKLIEILSNAKNDEEAYGNFTHHFNVSIDQLGFKNLVNEKLGGYNILQNDIVETRPSLQSVYLKLKVLLINAKWSGLLSKPLQFFFEPSIFWYAIGAITIFLIASFFTFSLLVTNPTNYTLLAGLIYFKMLIHELGHIGACAKYRLKHGGIGFGFYVLLPVLYADISNIWMADKERRIIANMGGIFAEMLYAALLVIVFLIIGDYTFLIAAFTISSFVLWEFNPFVRFDGYWILSDLTSMPNLMYKSKLVLQSAFSISAFNNWIKRGFKMDNDRKTFLLFLYGLLNTFLIFMVMGFIVLRFRLAIVNFPITLGHLVQKAFQLNLHFADFNGQFITILAFYILLLRLTWKYSNSFFKNISPKPIF
jgi:putative peptide zinc metalloprotease protein